MSRISKKIPIRISRWKTQRHPNNKISELLVGLRFALEDVVLHHAIGHRAGFLLLLVQRLFQQRFALAGAAIFGLYLIGNVDLFAGHDVAQLVDLLLQPDYAGKLRPVLAERLGVLRAERALLFGGPST